MYNDINKRFKEHCHDSKSLTKENRPLYAAMRKYGIENFHIEPLEYIEDISNLEEKEKFWIEQKHSFKDGYNATKGGDGKAYLDYDLIISVYQKNKSITETAKIVGASYSGVKNVLKNFNLLESFDINEHNKIVKDKFGKPCAMYDLEKNLLKVFSSRSEAANYIINKGVTKDTLSNVAARIGQVCNGKRKTAYNFIWENF